MDFDQLARSIKAWGLELGFQKVGIAGIDLREDEERLEAWLAQGRHGRMEYMQRHGTRRTRPAELIPGTLRVVSARSVISSKPSRPQRCLPTPPWVTFQGMRSAATTTS